MPASTSRITPIAVTSFEIEAIRTTLSGVTARLAAASARPSLWTEVTPSLSKVTRTVAAGCAAAAARRRRSGPMAGRYGNVIPAQAGISGDGAVRHETPAFAGVTDERYCLNDPARHSKVIDTRRLRGSAGLFSIIGSRSATPSMR